MKSIMSVQEMQAILDSYPIEVQSAVTGLIKYRKEVCILLGKTPASNDRMVYLAEKLFADQADTLGVLMLYKAVLYPNGTQEEQNSPNNHEGG